MSKSNVPFGRGKKVAKTEKGVKTLAEMTDHLDLIKAAFGRVTQVLEDNDRRFTELEIRSDEHTRKAELQDNLMGDMRKAMQDQEARIAELQIQAADRGAQLAKVSDRVDHIEDESFSVRITDLSMRIETLRELEKQQRSNFESLNGNFAALANRVAIVEGREFQREVPAGKPSQAFSTRRTWPISGVLTENNRLITNADRAAAFGNLLGCPVVIWDPSDEPGGLWTISVNQPVLRLFCEDEELEIAIGTFAFKAVMDDGDNQDLTDDNR